MGCVLCVPITYCLGFTASGIAAGSCAAGCQAAGAKTSPSVCFLSCLCYFIFIILASYFVLWYFGIQLPSWFPVGPETNGTTEGPLTMMLTGGRGFRNSTIL